jgi:ABC-type cobalt transport system substrate-binding protein
MSKVSFFRIFFLLLMVGMAVLSVPLSPAHMAGGADKRVGDYLIDMGYDPNPLFSGYPATFSVGLINATLETPIDVEKVWVRISTPDRVVYAGTHLPENGFAPISLVIPEGSNYTMSVRFYEEGQARSLASADFPIDVKGAPSQGMVGAYIGFFLLLGMIVAGVIGYIIGVARGSGKALNTKRKSE